MTCIIAYRQNGKVYMAGDRFGGSEYNKFTCNLPKIVKCGNVLLGASGSFHLDSILNHRLDILQVSENNLDKYIHTKFLSDLATQIMEIDYKSHAEGYKIQGDLLIAANNKIYLIEGFDSVIEINADYYAIGCGADYAHGAMSALKKDKKMSAKNRLIHAMTAVVEHCPLVSMPMDIITDVE